MLPMKDKKNLLTRSNLRDIVIICSFVSSAIFNLSVAAEAVGFCLLAIGCFLHIVAKGVLIRNVVLCDRGIYAIVRHPYYLANYLIDSSFCVLSGNPYLIAAYPLLFFWAYGPTIRNEEKFLASKYRDSFQDDSFNIPQVFPDRASLKGWRGLFQGFSFSRVTLKERARVARFCSAGFAIMLVQAVNLRQLRPLFYPTRTDYDEFSFMVLAAVFLLVSIVFVLMDRSYRAERDNRYLDTKSLAQ